MIPMAAIIINHNTCPQLQNCLRTVMACEPAQAIVVDNASTDGSRQMVRKEFPQVRLIENDRNPGYGGAANQAARTVQSPYLLLLNSDTCLQPDALNQLAAYLDAHPGAGIAGPRLRNGDGSLQPSCFPFPSPMDVFLDASHLGQLARFIPVLRERYSRVWPHDRPRPVSWVSGAAMAIRRSAFEEVGGFDESFFMYYEEVDLCYRMAKKRWQTHFAPVTEVIHLGGASTQQRRSEMALQFYRSLGQFYRTHYSHGKQVALVILLSMIATGRWLRDSVLSVIGQETEERQRRLDLQAAWRQMLTHRFRRELLRG